jgi:hypothetical protein
VSSIKRSSPIQAHGNLSSPLAGSRRDGVTRPRRKKIELIRDGMKERADDGRQRSAMQTP